MLCIFCIKKTVFLFALNPETIQGGRITNYKVAFVTLLPPSVCWCWATCLFILSHTIWEGRGQGHPPPSHLQIVSYVELRFPSTVFWGKVSFAPPLPYLWSIARTSSTTYICFLRYRWAAVYPNSFYLVTGLPVKRTDVTRTAYYPVTFGTGPYIYEFFLL